MTGVRTFVPGGRLAEFVELFWHQENEPGSHARERVLPTGSMGLVVALGDRPLGVYDGDGPETQLWSEVTISGARDSSFEIDTASHAASMGVVFRPAVAGPLLGMAAHEFARSHAPLAAAWGPLGAAFRDSLREAGTADARFALAERWLTPLAERTRRSAAITFAVERIARTNGGCAVSQLAADVGWSERHFSTVFSREVGLGPKQFGRVRRFQALLALLERQQRTTWADAAAACGYFDQSHLVREFRAISGCSPNEYLRRRTSHPNHLAA